MPATRLVAVVLFCCAAVCSQCAAQTASFHSLDQLPDIEIDGEKIKIHTQGLYATETDYIVTGRVDTPPRRPVMLRFPRNNPSEYQLLDLTLGGDAKAALNHPGGFDRDDNGVFWIPISTSHRRGPTTVQSITLVRGKLPETVAKTTRSFEISDHLGAICCLGNGRLLAANWDSKTVYVIDSMTGKIIETISHDVFFGDAHGVQLAVQDWKFDPASKLVVAGGIDKSKDRRTTDSNAVIAWIDPGERKITSMLRLDPRNDVVRPLTNEGMAVHDGRLFLLPEDFGRGAKVLRFDLTKDNRSK
jgi:hypothetical protein